MTRDDGLGPRPAAPRTRTMTRRRREHELAPAAPTHGPLGASIITVCLRTSTSSLSDSAAVFFCA